MGFFDGTKGKQIEKLLKDYENFEAVINKHQEEINSLKKELAHKTIDSEKEAKQHSKKAAEYRNRAEERLREAEEIIRQLNEELNVSRNAKDEINIFNEDAKLQKLEINETKSRLDDAESDFQAKLNTINSQIGNISSILEKYPDLNGQLLKLEEFSSTIEENVGKSTTSLNAINKRKKEVDDLKQEIFGYTYTDEDTGEEITVKGLKGELENTYKDLSENLENAEEEIKEMHKTYEESYQQFENDFKDKYKKINEDIASLLPNALTAGLSSAFSSKKEEEVKSSRQLQNRFSLGIYFLIAVSIIPLAVSIFFLTSGVELIEVIRRIPRLVLAIIPMYIPVLWFTYSANKKLNLSKRLIEEYAHKEVLSRTYEGLSTQIASIQNPEQSEELKFRLLTNFLQVSSENPGKLISNYEASDHPIMEALEQSYKFQIAMDRLEGVPGIGKIVARMQKNAKAKLNEKEEMIEQALADVDNNSDEENI